MSTQLISSVNDIKYCLYINLLSRVDRKEHIESQLTSIGIQPTRFNAIKLKNGRIGCSMSHLKCLEIAKKNNWPYVMICEDDLIILNKNNFIKHLNNFFRLHGDVNDAWNVLLLAGNNVPPYVKIDDTCIEVSHCQTTTGYIIKQCYYDTLIDNIRTGIHKLMKYPDNHVLYAIDKYWIQLQKIHPWYMIVPVEAVQREDYSDIEKRQTNYENIMKDVDKHALVRNLYANNSYITPDFIKNINKSSPNSTTQNSTTQNSTTQNYTTQNSTTQNSTTQNSTTANYNSQFATKKYYTNESSTNSVKPTQHRQTLRVSNYNPLRKKFYGFSLNRYRTRKVAYY
jgi:GR25 family glycosyltransferase involved in LPS biosynthesis